ncbi:hypothetical protein TWF696_005025 [Orbilia brochopaga]|uniref:Ubiquitin-like domain-containing protein n=1 Tax=Orbilia brochopaga TaxID=3140254 RepID=A0AAV9V2R5_9PEZI
MASEAGPVAQQNELKPFRIRVYRQGIVETDPIAVEIPLSSTVRDLKEKVKDATSDAPDAQRLIYQGKQLEDNATLRETFQNILDDPNPITLHAVIRPPDEASSFAPPVRGFFRSQPPSSQQASSSTSSAAGTSRGHAASPRRPNTTSPQPRGGAPIGPAVNFNDEVTITTTSGSFFPNPQNFDNRSLPPSGASFFRNSQASGSNGESAQTSRSSQPSSETTDSSSSNPSDRSTHSTPFTGARSNSFYQRIVRTQTHTVRIRHQAHSGTSSAPPGATAYSTSYSAGPSSTSIQGAPMQSGVAGSSTGPSLGTPPVPLPRSRSEPAGDNAASTTATSTLSNPAGAPGSGGVDEWNTSAVFNELNAIPPHGGYVPAGFSTQFTHPPEGPTGPFIGANAGSSGVPAFPTMPSLESTSAYPQGQVGLQEQYWLLQGPDGPSALLLSPMPPPAPSIPRRTPLGPVHLSPPPGWSLNEPLIDPPVDDRNWGDLTAREAALRQQLQETHAANGYRFAALDEERRHIIEMQRLAAIHITNLANLAAQMQGQQPLLPQLPYELQEPPQRPPQQPLHQPLHQAQQAQQQQQQPALERLRRNPIDFLLDTLLWFFRGNQDQAQPERRDQRRDQRRARNRANMLMDNAWLLVRLGFAIFLLGGGTDLRRDLFLWIVVIVIFVWQSGLFNDFLQPIVERLNNLIPDPARLAGQPQPPLQPAEGELQPQDLAQRLVAEHQARQQQGGGLFDTIQNGVSIFLASLVPGLGERIGVARQRERERERRLIEEAAQAQQEGQPGAEGAAAEGGDVQGLPPVEGQAPGPQDPNIVNAAQQHFGEARAEELFGPQQPLDGQEQGLDQGEQGPVDAFFGAL